jgi:putative DNA primase/helicase
VRTITHASAHVTCTRATAASCVTLAEVGIHLRDERPGEHRAPCPKCARTKHRARDDALAVRVEADGGATWTCHRCGWRGGIGPEREYRQTERRPRIQASHAKLEKKGEVGRGHQSDNVTLKDRVPQPFSPLDAERWARARPILPGTPAADYLERRGCALPDPEGDLRWHPKVRNWTCGHVGPALVALITDAVTVEPKSLHFTWIRPDGAGKAAVDRPRLYLPRHEKKGGVVRLWPDEALTYGLCAGEGLETCLTAAHGFTPVWACLDAGNLGELPALPGVEALTIVADHDEAGLRAAYACARRWAQDGAEVRIWKPPAAGTDLNDYASREAAA